MKAASEDFDSDSSPVSEREAAGTRPVEKSKDDKAVDYILSILGTVEPFTPLTREEANDRYY